MKALYFLASWMAARIFEAHLTLFFIVKFPLGQKTDDPIRNPRKYPNKNIEHPIWPQTQEHQRINKGA